MKITLGKSRALLWLLLWAVCMLQNGCNRSRSPVTVPVQGKVTWRGQSLTDGTVTFDPVQVAEGLPKRPAIGELGADGVYRLSTFRPNDGVVPGEYRITVHSYVSRPVSSLGLEGPRRPPVWRIPERYGDSVRSGLSFTVPADARGQLTHDIDIK